MPDEKNELEQILDEHRGCMELVARVEDSLDSLPEQIRGGKLVSQLRKLEDTMRQHFKGEEEGFFTQLPLEQPHLAPRFQKLEDEHPGILELLASVIEEAEQLERNAAPGPQPQLRARIQRLILTLHRHEAEENELVMDATWDTLGTMD